MKNIFIKIISWYLNAFHPSNKVRDFLTWPVASRILGKRYDEVTVLKNGLKMKTDLGDILGRFVIFYGPKVKYFWEPQTTRLMEVLIKNVHTAIIAGSHIGYLALMARRAMIKTEGRLFAFEPVSYLHKISAENFKLNENIGKINLENKALSSASGKVTISVDSLRSAIVTADSSENVENVEAISVDEFIKKEHISSMDFMLLDVEGHEPAVFTGMKNLLNKNYPQDIIFEYSPQIKGSLGDLKDYLLPLRNFGYHFYVIADDYALERVKVSAEDVTLYDLAENIRKFFHHNYFNVLATKRDAEELKKLSIKIIF
ncbi:MAG: FkbM family methyltransferase [bacterium]|nr:FkbM family methyltransferase [bacterium]